MNKDELIEQIAEEYYLEQIAERELEENIDEIVECDIEELKFSEREKIVLLEALLKEITSQIESKKPNLLKLKEMIK